MTEAGRHPRAGLGRRRRLVLVCAAALCLYGLWEAGAARGQDSAVKKLNPFTGKADAIQQGRTLWLQYGCSGCHGVQGGGGMGSPVSDDAWKFGSDDETLFKLIKGQIAAQTMPKIYDAMPDEEAWKIIAYVRSVYAGDKSRINW